MLTNTIAKTLLLPLKARAIATLHYASLKFKDNFSVQIWEQLHADFSEGENINFIESITTRTSLFDRVVTDFLEKNPTALVVHLGAGLCTRYQRIQTTNKVKWCHVDFKEVIALRNSFLPPSTLDIAVDITKASELEILLQEVGTLITSNEPVLFVAEGLSYYLNKAEVKQWLLAIEQFAVNTNVQVSCAFDYVHPKYPLQKLIEQGKSYFNGVAFYSGFTSPNDLFSLLEKQHAYCLYKLPFSYLWDQNYMHFISENNGENPYEVIQLNFSDKESRLGYTYEDKNIDWNTEFSINYLNNGLVMFLSSTSFHFFSVEEITLAKFYLTDASSFSFTMKEIHAIYAVEKLISKNLLTDKTSNFLQNQKLEIEDGGFCKEIWRNNDFVQKIILQCKVLNIRYAICENIYLPELYVQLFEQIELGEKVIAIYIYENKVCVSPVFTNKESLTVFLNAVKMNQPHRVWATSFSKNIIKSPFNLTFRITKKQEDEVLRVLYQNLSDDNEINLFTEINTEGEQVIHTIVDYQKVEKTTELNLQSEKIVSFSSGFRTKTAKKILLDLQPFISDLLGCVSTPKQISSWKSKSFTYSSTYPQQLKRDITDFQFFGHALGKGLSKEQSKISALAEGVERFCMNYNGEEDFLISPYQNTDRFVNPLSIFRFSEQQYKNSKKYLPFPLDQEIPWAVVFSLSKKVEKLVPAEMCFRNINTDSSVQYFRSSSNGCATGNTVKEAILQGLLELVERDAVALWWYQKRICSGVDISKHQEFIDLLATENWKVWVLDVTTNLAIPTMVAVAQHMETKEYRLGFGAHLDADIAIARAISEVHQIIEVADFAKADFDFSKIKEESYLLPHGIKNQKPLCGITTIDEAIVLARTRIEEQGFEVLYKNLSRSDLSLKTVKVFVPGLCFIWPEFGNSRLYQNNLGETVFTENQLNPLALFV